MARASTGSIRWRSGSAYARVTVDATTRPEFRLPTCRTEAEANERAELLATLAGRLRATGHAAVAEPFLERAATRDGRALADVVAAIDRVCAGDVAIPKQIGTTFQAFAEEWTSGRLRERWPDHVKAKKTHDDDRGRFENHVYPIVGHVPLAEFSIDDADAVMRALPPGLAPLSRRQIAQSIHRVLGLAVYPARLLLANPLPRGFMPTAKTAKAFTHLYPAEDRALLACVGVPLEARMLWGFLAREGMRTSEAGALTWSALDLENGAVALDENKTDDPRSWALDPSVANALRAWHELRGAPEPSALVFDLDDTTHASRAFRAHLKAAKLDRPALFDKSATRQPIRAHDLRATFITIALANGRSETWVQDRTGHTSSVMINRYRRASRSFAELGLGTLAPLDEAIPEVRATLEKGKEAGKGPIEASTVSAEPPKVPRSWRSGRVVEGDGFETASAVSNRREPLDSREIREPFAPVRDAFPASGPNEAPLGPPRGRAIHALRELVVAAAVAGDHDLVRVLGDALRTLTPPAPSADVHDLDDARTRRRT